MFRKLAPVIAVVFVVAGIAAIAWTGVSKSPEEFDAARLKSDLETSGRVRTVFARSSRLANYDIDVESSNGLVTLGGAVPREADRELAEGVARDVEGVSRIENKITVDADARPSEDLVREAARVADLEIRATIRERIAFEDALKGTKVLVGVKDHRVRLSGTVESEEQKALVERLARGVAGVAGVENEVVVGGIGE
jgi:hyperosmotically inducible periplasmic protein